MTHATVFPRLPALHRLAFVAAAGIVAVVAARPAQAIERCRIDGQLVLQAAPCPQPAAPKPALVDANSVEPVAKRSIVDVMREREAAIRARPAKESVPDGSKILRERMGAL